MAKSKCIFLLKSITYTDYSMKSKTRMIPSFSFKSTSFSALLFLFFLFSCQNEKKEFLALDISLLEAVHEQYQEKSITERRFKHAQAMPLVKGRLDGHFVVEEIGKSVEGKEIFQMTIGDGPTKVMLWSQMHGNESTATMALFDLFNFLEAKDDDFEDLRNTLKSKLTLRFIPMVNPDGMDNWTRRNAFDIDLNRDAIKQTSPEAIVLKNARDNFSPAFGFNLHDQQVYYNVSQTEKPATISVLAPAYNYATEVNDVRKNAMQVIVGMNRVLQQIVPGQVGKYDDAFEPRAFGDNFQKWGTSTILIESGGYKDDPEKQYIRKLNFIIILNALSEIANGSHDQYVLEDYYKIPDNDLKLMDLILKNLALVKNETNYGVDLGIRRREADANDSFFVNGTIDDLGDLSVFYGFEEFDAAGMEVVQGKIYETSFKNPEEITMEKSIELLKKGFLGVKVIESLDRQSHAFPILLLKNKTEIPTGIEMGGSPNFFLAKDGKLKYAVVNGYLIDLENPATQSYRQKVM
ncbi:Zinc carboxypeptidase [Rhodonellum ikkaensis]|nr:Zinc carboxypeptidase [Rhodonellum ikkaensis]